MPRLSGATWPESRRPAAPCYNINPDNADGLILLGRLSLARHNTDEALRLALGALAPTDVDALSLPATKMKKSWSAGLWWRWNQLLIRLGESRAIFLVVGIWVIYRWSVLASRDAGLPEAIRHGPQRSLSRLRRLHHLGQRHRHPHGAQGNRARVRLNPRF